MRNGIILVMTFLRWSSGLQHTALMSANEGYRLQGWIFYSTHVPTSTECGQNCLVDQRCRSVNYKPLTSKSEYNCELNNFTKDEKPESLRKATGFTYYEPIKQNPTRSNEFTTPTAPTTPCTQTAFSPLTTTNAPTTNAASTTNAPTTTKAPTATTFHAKSCSDYLSQNTSGPYPIEYSDNSNSFNVYCHFDYNLNKSWTLVLSFSYENNKPMKSNPFWIDKPINHTTPNFVLYRMSLRQMKHIQQQSTKWRAVCNYRNKLSDQRDSVRGNFKIFDPMTQQNISNCINVDYVNIRGHSCTKCTALWYQSDGMFLHIDSQRDIPTCTFLSAIDNAKLSEDNFGYYDYINSKFGCTKYENSTTSWWFGN